MSALDLRSHQSCARPHIGVEAGVAGRRRRVTEDSREEGGRRGLAPRAPLHWKMRRGKEAAGRMRSCDVRGGGVRRHGLIEERRGVVRRCHGRGK